MKLISHFYFILFLLIQTSCITDIVTIEFGAVLYGKVTNSENGQPIKGVVISDGYSTSITDIDGYYSLKAHVDARHVFYSVPSEYEITLSEGYPNFFKSINPSLDSLETNFELVRLQNGIENKFTLLFVADPQIYDDKALKRHLDETIPDISNEYKNVENIYGITLGDIVSDTPEYFGDMKQSFISTGIPFFHTIGNHDFLEDIENPISSMKAFENHFGPVNYSFNRGNAHIIVMSNMIYKGNRSYDLGLTNEQMMWLKSDLKHVTKDKMLIICMHVPIQNDKRFNPRNEFFELIKNYNEVHIFTGHNHQNTKYWHEEYQIFEHTIAASSGMWWVGTVNKCGTPNGYSVFEIENNKMKNWYYKPTNYSKDYQIRMYAPNTFGDTEGYLVANVWNADHNWKVELIENGVNRGTMERFHDYDPGTYSYLKSTNRIEPGNDNASLWYVKTNHLYRIKPNDLNGDFLIRATDPFGNVYILDKPEENINKFRRYN